jgi:hypothetical protein
VVIGGDGRAYVALRDRSSVVALGFAIAALGDRVMAPAVLARPGNRRVRQLGSGRVTGSSGRTSPSAFSFVEAKAVAIGNRSSRPRASARSSPIGWRSSPVATWRRPRDRALTVFGPARPVTLYLRRFPRGQQLLLGDFLQDVEFMYRCAA